MKLEEKQHYIRKGQILERVIESLVFFHGILKVKMGFNEGSGWLTESDSFFRMGL